MVWFHSTRWLVQSVQSVASDTTTSSMLRTIFEYMYMLV